MGRSAKISQRLGRFIMIYTISLRQSPVNVNKAVKAEDSVKGIQRVRYIQKMFSTLKDSRVQN